MIYLSESLLASYRMKSIRQTCAYHSHHEYEIYLFHSGSCRYLIHNQIYDLKPGDIILMDGLTLHKPNVNLNSEYIRSVIHFSPHWIQGILEELGSGYLLDTFEKHPHCLIRTSGNKQSKELEKIIKKMEVIRSSEDRHNHTNDVELKVLLIQALIIVYKLAQAQQINFTTEKIDKAEHAENIASYIQKHYREKLTLDSISDALNLSKSYVSHLFKEMTGFTVMEYVMGCRLNQTKYLLEMEPEKSIKDIAYESGFESASHFSRYFRSKVGMNARDYRRIRLNLYHE